MIRNYLKIAWRNLWHNRLYTSLNIIGLAIGISAAWVIYRLASYEFAFDQYHPHKERIFRLVTRYQNGGLMPANPGVPLPMITEVKTRIPGIDLSVPIRQQWVDHLLASRPSGKPAQFRAIEQVVATTPNYFVLLPYQWLAGNPQQALREPNSVVLTQSRAQRYFPGSTIQQVLGRTLTYFDSLTLQITGIVADPVQPSSFEGREFISLTTLGDVRRDPSFNWDNINSADQLFVKLAPNINPQRAEQQINALAATHSPSVRMKNGVRERWHLLQPLATLHFDTEYADASRHANRNVLYGLLGLAAFILLLAVINYINLATAQAPARAREIGIRKTLGSRRRTLLLQFVGETGLVTILALLLSFGLSAYFFAQFGDLLPSGTQAYINWSLTAAFLVGLILVVSLLAGSYPAWLATGFQPIAILRGKANQLLGSSRGITVRKGLIVFQFVMAQLFISCAWLLGQQLQYALKKDMGFYREAVVLLQLPTSSSEKSTEKRTRWTFRQEIANLPGVDVASLGNPPANQSMSMNEATLKKAKGDVKIHLQYKYVDTNYIHLYQISLIAGRNITPTDTIRDYVINETAARTLGFTQPHQAVGQFLQVGQGHYPIVGIVRDFQVSSVREKIRPVALVAYQGYANQLNLRLASNNPADWKATLTKVGQVWHAFYPNEPFVYAYYDQTVAAFYESERTTGRIINLATGVAILLSCLGLFGLATLTAYQRTKEIGVRKVLGASVLNILGLLSGEFIQLTLLAILIASPLAWYVTGKWLEGFAYKIEINWWVFALAGLLGVVITLLTVSFQSIKAALVNPVKSLRSE